MYMRHSVSIEELRQNLSLYLRTISRGVRLVVSRNRPVAEPRPAPTTDSHLDRLIAASRVSRPARSRLPEPFELPGDPRALSRALDDIRGNR